MTVLEARLLWGGTVIAVERLAEGASLVVGEGEGARFQLSEPALPGPRHHLARVSSAGAFVDLPPGFTALVDDRRVTSPFVLEPGQTATIPLGALEVALQWTAREPRVWVPLTRALDLLYTRVLGSLLAAQAALVGALLLTPTFGDDDGELFTNPGRFKMHALVQPQKREPVRVLASAERRGSKPSPERPATLEERRAPARALSARAAAAAALDELGLGRVATASVLGDAMNHALDGLKGPAAADGSGRGGLAGRGLGGGGGRGTLDIGALSGPDVGAARRGIEIGGRGRPGVVVDTKPPVTTGALSREEIQRAMRRVLNQIRFCYERELQRAPDLEGKLAVLFVIAPDGAVASASAKENTLGSAEVEGCVLRVVRRLRFPSPRGAGQVVVTYPFVFSSAG